MTAPQYDPAAFAAFMQQQAPQAPAAPQAQFPAQQPGYGVPPQMSQGYPTTGYQHFAPQMPQGYAPQMPQQQPQIPAEQPVSASLDDFYSQPSTGWGPSITPIGTTPDGTVYTLVVAQHITRAHVEHKTKFQSTALDYYRNGKPKLVMKIPAYVAPGTQYSSSQGGVQVVDDGRAQLYIQGPDKELLSAAMAMAGVHDGPPELGAVIRVTKTHNRANRSGTQSAVKTFEYWRPGAEAAAFAQQSGIQYPDLSTPKPTDGSQAAPAAPAPQVPAQPAAPVVEQPAFSQPMQTQAFTGPQPMSQAPVTPPAAPQAQAAPPQPPAPAAPNGLPADKAALLAQLTGQTAGS